MLNCLTYTVVKMNITVYISCSNYNIYTPAMATQHYVAYTWSTMTNRIEGLARNSGHCCLKFLIKRVLSSDRWLNRFKPLWEAVLCLVYSPKGYLQLMSLHISLPCLVFLLENWSNLTLMCISLFKEQRQYAESFKYRYAVTV